MQSNKPKAVELTPKERQQMAIRASRHKAHQQHLARAGGARSRARRRNKAFGRPAVGNCGPGNGFRR